MNKKTLKNILKGIVLTGALAVGYKGVESHLKKPTYDRVKPVYTLRADISVDNDKVKAYLDNLEKVPDQMQQIINKEGKVIFFNGMLKELPEFEETEGPKQRWKNQKAWEKSNAAYDHNTRSMFLGVEGDYNKPEPQDALHEYGHLIDFLGGKAIYGYALNHRHEIIDIHEFDKGRLDDYQKESIHEYVAETFRMYYESEDTRKDLEENFPERFKWAESIEDKVIDMKYDIFRGY